MQLMYENFVRFLTFHKNFIIDNVRYFIANLQMTFVEKISHPLPKRFKILYDILIKIRISRRYYYVLLW